MSQENFYRRNIVDKSDKLGYNVIIECINYAKGKIGRIKYKSVDHILLR